MRIHYKCRVERGINFGRTISGMCRKARSNKFSAWEVMDYLALKGVTLDNRDNPITKTFIHGWFRSLGFKRLATYPNNGCDWWTMPKGTGWHSPRG